MDDSMAYKFLRFQGQELCYFDENNVKQKRVLLEVLRHPVYKYEACFKYSNPVKRILLDKKRVPLQHVLLPDEPKTNSTKNPSQYQQPQPNNFRYNNETYHITCYANFKTGDEVVWTKYSTEYEVCLGKVVVTGERHGVTGHTHSLAIVQLERVPHPAPKYVSYLEGVTNTFAVYMDELLKLDEWIAIATTKFEDENKNDPPNSENFEMSQIPQPSAPPMLPQRPKSVSGSSDDEYSTSPKAEAEWHLQLNPDRFSRYVETTAGNGVGIQGNDNSCYMDASLFALFSFNHSLDNMLIKNGTSENTMKEVLRNDIIYRMRQDRYFVPNQNIRKLRKIFAGAVNKEYMGRYMDVEEFLSDIFKLLKTPPFIHYDNGGGDHIHQIALPFTWDKSQYVPYLSLQTLLENSFKTFDVKFERKPENLFIVKLPVSDGILIPSQGVIPNFILNLENVMATKEKAQVMLQAVICLRKSHFVTFVRTSNSYNSPWVYMDSKPTTKMPFVSILNDMDKKILAAAHELEIGSPKIRSFEPTCEDFRLFQHAYICIYADLYK